MTKGDASRAPVHGNVELKPVDAVHLGGVPGGSCSFHGRCDLGQSMGEVNEQ